VRGFFWCHGCCFVQAVKERPEINVEGKTVVLILPDGVRNYVAKFADDRWMEN
jgi:cystathionine beta-synthase